MSGDLFDPDCCRGADEVFRRESDSFARRIYVVTRAEADVESALAARPRGPLRGLSGLDHPLLSARPAARRRGICHEHECGPWLDDLGADAGCPFIHGGFSAAGAVLYAVALVEAWADRVDFQCFRAVDVRTFHHLPRGTLGAADEAGIFRLDRASVQFVCDVRGARVLADGRRSLEASLGRFPLIDAVDCGN